AEALTCPAQLACLHFDTDEPGVPPFLTAIDAVQEAAVLHRRIVMAGDDSIVLPNFLSALLLDPDEQGSRPVAGTDEHKVAGNHRRGRIHGRILARPPALAEAHESGARVDRNQPVAGKEESVADAVDR